VKDLITVDFEKGLELSGDEIKHYIAQLEEQMKLGTPIEIPLEHYFSKDLYGREIKIPAGALLVGKIHKFQCMNVLSEGEVSVLSIDGVKRFKAPFTFVSSPGAKRVIYAHQNSTWSTFHATSETDIDKLEKELIAENYDEVVPLLKNKGDVCLL
jgi:hypothetical protein